MVGENCTPETPDWYPVSASHFNASLRKDLREAAEGKAVRRDDLLDDESHIIRGSN